MKISSDASRPADPHARQKKRQHGARKLKATGWSSWCIKVIWASERLQRFLSWWLKQKSFSLWSLWNDSSCNSWKLFSSDFLFLDSEREDQTILLLFTFAKQNFSGKHWSCEFLRLELMLTEEGSVKFVVRSLIIVERWWERRVKQRFCRWSWVMASHIRSWLKNRSWQCHLTATRFLHLNVQRIDADRLVNVSRNTNECVHNYAPFKFHGLIGITITDESIWNWQCHFCVQKQVNDEVHE